MEQSLALLAVLGPQGVPIVVVEHLPAHSAFSVPLLDRSRLDILLVLHVVVHTLALFIEFLVVEQHSAVALNILLFVFSPFVLLVDDLNHGLGLFSLDALLKAIDVAYLLARVVS